MFKQICLCCERRNGKSMLRWSWNFVSALVCFCLAAALAGCQSTPLPKINLAEPGWTVRQGQAIWRAGTGIPDMAGDLLVATNTNGRTLIQFTKTPFPMIVAQATTNAW